MAGATRPAATSVDLRLLGGFTFRCRPDCGLCCYATPAASADEQQELLQIEPSLRFVGGSGEFRLIPAREDGGGCHFLAGNRCQVHDLRPFPCREFPLSVHIGGRLQAALVLSCPGLDVEALRKWSGPRGPQGPGDGFEDEIAEVAREAAALDVSSIASTRRRWERALRREGLDDREETLRSLRGLVASRSPFPTAEDLSELRLPDLDDGVSALPLYFDDRFGRVAIAAAPDGAQLLQLRESGGVSEVLGEFAAPGTVPRLEPAARSLLDGYLAYAGERDALLGMLLEEGGSGDLPDRMLRELRAIGAAVISRAVWRAQLGGRDGGRLTGEDVVRGVAATDAEVMDRTTVGAFL